MDPSVSTFIGAFEARDNADGYWRRVVSISRTRWRTFAVFCVAIYGFNLFRISAVVPLDDPVWAGIAIGRESAGELLIWSPICFAAIVTTEAVRLTGKRHALLSLGAQFAAIVVSLLVIQWWYGGLINRPLVEAHYVVSDQAYVWRSFWTNLAWAILLVSYYAIKDREAASARLARDVELERTQAHRATMAARLKVMQARVEPELLFGALAQVRRMYARDAAAADALLDDLITYLRAALPQMRSDTSTVDREVALAAAYLKLLPLVRGGHLTIELPDISSGINVPFPPMVLLPLVQAAAESNVSQIRITLDDSRRRDVGFALCIDLKPSRPSYYGWTDERLAPLRATLTQYFGLQGQLIVDSSRAVVQWHAAGGAHETSSIKHSPSRAAA